MEYDDDDEEDFYARPQTPPRTIDQRQHPQQLFTPAPFNGTPAGSGQINRSNTPSPPPLLDHSHLRPGAQASLLSYERTLALYRENAKKTNLPEVQYEFAVFMIDAVKSLPIPTLATANQLEIEKVSEKREDMIREATGLLKKLADRGHPDSQYFLADCYANGIGTVRGRQDFDRAYPLFVLAAKHGHTDAAYRSGTCCENGWGCRRESSKAVQFYRKAGAASHPGAMYRLGLAELNGELGLAKSPREGVKWLKRSAEHATAEFPHALHELALLHERGVDNVLFVDYEYAAELLAQAAELGYAPSAYKLGECYEYGKMGCPQDPALSIHYYNIAAQQNHRDACFALTAWYLVGSPGVLPQSDTEAYLWAKKAAEQGLPKAQYAVGYFTEVYRRTNFPLRYLTARAIQWYKKAAETGDKRAIQRLRTLAPNALPQNIRYPKTPEAAVAGADDDGEPLDDGPSLGVTKGVSELRKKEKDKDCVIM
ncbi:HCP-like protein [Clavulina sp. PMI_390]|nr:HCP-like protein [Clavulina sp. PMI_390]